MVEFSDRSVLAQLSLPDMRLPIQYALTYPQREKSPEASLDLAQVRRLTFQRPDQKKFPCLQLAYDAADVGGTMPAVLNAANEEAVQAFLDRAIGFTDIPVVIGNTISRHQLVHHPNLGQILTADGWARETARDQVSRIAQGRKQETG
jgi:1-deoxy-D-xylulose-5-phosphate reductoisomerase